MFVKGTRYSFEPAVKFQKHLHTRYFSPTLFRQLIKIYLHELAIQKFGILDIYLKFRFLSFEQTHLTFYCFKGYQSHAIFCYTIWNICAQKYSLNLCRNSYKKVMIFAAHNIIFSVKSNVLLKKRSSCTRFQAYN